ncbi:MAG: PrsW family glutamic-type intramembrane protease [Sphaerochaetaceae bacterium]|jgi:RsiW-degrading membrane proteinase PrsW (M82 family)|nr:PrsW family glutamic-type intramembrane protease [Sphaerochaetaceae bacterium]
MFFMIPMRITVLIYMAAALLPGFFLLRYIYKKDTVEKEDPKLLGSLLLQGVWAALCSIVLEMVGESLLDLSLSQDSPYYVLVLAFLVVGVVEEGTKFFFLKRRTWKIPDFNYTFDAIVYAVFVSMGFALFENVKYVFGYGLSVALPRAFLAVPGHMGFAVFMGYFYGRAKVAESRGDAKGKTLNLILSYVIAVLLHGFYDATAMMSTSVATILYIVFVVVMYIVVIRLVRKESSDDRRIW